MAALPSGNGPGSSAPPGSGWRGGAAAPDTGRRLDALAGEMLSRCRGEGPANCEARCPLGVDARGYVQLTRSGRYRDALQLIRRRLPFPGVLGYVCSRPCELHCKRLDTDRAIPIREIKRFLAEWEQGPPQHLVDCEDPLPHRLAVVGAGPAGLIAAHDLARLGYRVTLVECRSRLGGCLVDKIPAWRLPRAVVERDLSVIEALGIEVRTGVTVGVEVTLDDLRRDFDAVALAPGFGGVRDLLRNHPRLAATSRGTLAVDPERWETSVEGVFASGDAVIGPSTVVEAMAVGRHVAARLHAALAGAPTGPPRAALVPRPLLWRLEITEAERLERVPPVRALEECPPAMTEAEVLDEAERCLDCSCRTCVAECEFLGASCGSPKEIARQVRGGLEQHLRMVYSCNLCGLCREVCPVDLDTGEMLREARREAVRRGLGPLPSHRRARRSLRLGRSDALTLTAREPGRRQTRRAFFPGCALSAASPRTVVALYERLRRELPRTGVVLACCGAPADALGLEAEAGELAGRVVEEVERLGAEELLVACPDCSRHLARFAPELPVRSVWGCLSVREPGSRPERVVVHDPCAARGDPSTLAALRSAVEGCGCQVVETEFEGARTRCCGAGGVLPAVDRQLADRVARRTTTATPLTIVTGCAGCHASLRRVRGDVHHVAELLLDIEQVPARRAGADATWRGLLNRWRTREALRRLLPIGAE